MSRSSIYSRLHSSYRLKMAFAVILVFSLGILIGKYTAEKKSNVYLPVNTEVGTNNTERTASPLPKPSSLSVLDPSKKIIANNTEDRITFELEGNNQVHSIEIPQNWILLPTDSKKRYIPYSKGTDYTYTFSNGAIIELIRAPTVFRFVDYCNHYVEWNQREYAINSTTRDGGSIVTSKLNWYKLQYESKTINEDENNTVGNTYYGFLLIPSSGPTQNVWLAVSAPAGVENAEESIQYILNSLSQKQTESSQ